MTTRTASRVWLAAEYLVLFFGAVAVFAWLAQGLNPLPLLAVLAGLSYWYLRRKPGFDRAALWRPSVVPGQLRSILPLWAATAVLVGIALAVFAPERPFALPRSQPLLWALIMVLYPLLSVYPQELVFRAFVLERYAPLFGRDRLAAAASAAAFGFVHIIYGNVLAVGMSLVGGWLFARRYQRSGSLLAASVEHALYGQLVFTIGLGDFFYHGAR